MINVSDREKTRSHKRRRRIKADQDDIIYH